MNSTPTIRKIFAVSLLFLSLFSLQGKKVKELIELSDNSHEPKNNIHQEQEKLLPNSPEKNIPVENKQKKNPSIVTNQKTSASVKIPVVAHTEIIKPTPKSDSSIKVIYLDNKKEEKKTPRKLRITNGITKNMITYHYLGERVPSRFLVSFNDRPYIELADALLSIISPEPFFLEEDIMHVSFHYQFDYHGMVYRKGGKKITYRIPPHLNEIIPTFDWHKPEKVIIAQAELVSCCDL